MLELSLRGKAAPMSTLHCPLCGLRFRYGSELGAHAREDHAPPPTVPTSLPAPRPKEHLPEREPVLHLPW